MQRLGKRLTREEKRAIRRRQVRRNWALVVAVALWGCAMMYVIGHYMIPPAWVTAVTWVAYAGVIVSATSCIVYAVRGRG